MTWGMQVQNCIVYLSLAAICYVMCGWLFRRTTPGGKLNWRGRRWRRGWTFALLLFGGVLEGREIFSYWGGALLGLRVIFWGLVGLLALLLLRWWWHDWQNEKIARQALLEKQHHERRELVPPQMSRGQKFWNWVLIAYGTAGLLGGLYEVVLHLLKK